jgi:hypothetical protein
MIYIEMLTYYLIIGLITALTVEFVVKRVDKYLKENNQQEDVMPWSNAERIVTILVWPYTMIIFVIAGIKFTKNKK